MLYFILQSLFDKEDSKLPPDKYLWQELFKAP